MPALAPLKFTFYDPETFEVAGEYICNFVPLKFIKLAIRLSKSLVNVNPDTLNGLILDLFGRQFSVDELVKHSEQNDRMMVLQDLLQRARSFTSNKDDPAGETANGTGYELEDEDWIVDLEISLIKAFDWSLKDIDETDIESLMPFVAQFAGTNIKTTKKNKIYCDEVSWI